MLMLSLSRNPCKVCLRQENGNEKGILPTQLRDGNVRATTSGQTKVNYPETNLREVQFLLDGWEANTTEQKQHEDLMLAKEDGTRPSWNLFLTSLEI